jgi:hypothetical protein
MLQAGGSRVSDPIRLVNVFNLLNLSGLTRPWGLLNLWLKWVPEAEKQCFWEVKCYRCVRLITLPPSMSRHSRQREIFSMSHPYRSSPPVTGIALPFTLHVECIHYSSTSRYDSWCKIMQSLQVIIRLSSHYRITFLRSFFLYLSEASLSASAVPYIDRWNLTLIFSLGSILVAAIMIAIHFFSGVH